MKSLLLICSILISLSNQAFFLSTTQNHPGKTITKAGKVQLLGLQQYISGEKCQFYQYLHKNLGYCGNNNYLLEYGLAYCQKFTQRHSEFRQKRWVPSMVKCLQRKVYESLAQATTYPTCAHVE